MELKKQIEDLKPSFKESVKDGLKEAGLFTLVGPVAFMYGKSKPINIPFNTIENIEIVERRHSIFGKKRFIELTIGERGRGISITFAPYTGTIKRSFKTDEFYNELKSIMNREELPTIEIEGELVEIETSKPTPHTTPHIETITKKRVINYCPNCGVKVKPTDKFCRKCGRELR